jgi:anti-sigma factor RsiW
MSCEKTVKDILPYIDGRLQEERRAGVEKHLKTCAACQLRTDRLRAVTRLLDELPVIEPSTAFDTRVRALLAGEPLKPSWLARLRFSPRAVFATSLLLLATLWLGFYERPSTPASPWSDPKVADEQLIQDLPVLEDHDLLSNFEPLKELSSPSQAELTSDAQHTAGQEERADRH